MDYQGDKISEQKTSSNLNKEGVKSIQGVESTKSEWVDRGIIDVPVADLPIPEGVSNTSDFNHHITWEDARTATSQLPDIQAEVKGGKTDEDFSKDDEKDGQSWQTGKRRIYDLFYGNDPVVLDKDGDQYTIVSGRHRIFAAKELGLETIPAKVTEKVKILD